YLTESRWCDASNPIASGRICALCQKRISHKLAKPKTMAAVVQSAFMERRCSHQFPPTQKTRATAPNSSQSGQTLVRAVSVRSLLSIELPRPGNLGEVARAAPRQAEPANEAIQFWSLRSDSSSPLSDNHKAGGPLSLNTLASIRFGPSCSNPETSTVKASFQL